MSIHKLLQLDLARAEAAVAGSKHKPTTDNFAGQALAYKRTLALLEMEKITPPGPVEIHRELTITIPWKVLASLVASGTILVWCSRFLS